MKSCLFFSDTSVYSIKVGSIILGDGTIFGVKKIIVHNFYDPPVSYNDIAIVIVNSTFNFDNKVSPVCLAYTDMSSNHLSGMMASVAGFGDTKYGGEFSPVLQKTFVPIVSKDECARSYRHVLRAKFPLGITHSVICAGFKFGARDACEGDSGGPLTISFHGVHFLVGIVSVGNKCGEPDFPGIYTSVAFYRNWIANIIIKNRG